MADFSVRWCIDVEADSAEEAARKALDIQRDAGSEAVVFEVQQRAARLTWVEVVAGTFRRRPTNGDWQVVDLAEGKEE